MVLISWARLGTQARIVEVEGKRVVVDMDGVAVNAWHCFRKWR
jgi:hypothetical protein